MLKFFCIWHAKNITETSYRSNRFISNYLSEEKFKLFHDGDRYHVETSPLNCKANQWTGFYMITTPVMKELSNFHCSIILQEAKRLREYGVSLRFISFLENFFKFSESQCFKKILTSCLPWKIIKKHFSFVVLVNLLTHFEG